MNSRTDGTDAKAVSNEWTIYIGDIRCSLRYNNLPCSVDQPQGGSSFSSTFTIRATALACVTLACNIISSRPCLGHVCLTRIADNCTEGRTQQSSKHEKHKKTSLHGGKGGVGKLRTRKN